MKARNDTRDQQARAKFVGGIGGVMEEGNVQVAMIGQQMENVIALAPNGNIEEGVQANVEVEETFTTAYVKISEVELQRIISMIKD